MNVFFLTPQILAYSFNTFIIFLLIFIYLAETGLSCGMCSLFSCSLWDQFPDQGLNPDPLHWELGVLATRPSGKS